MVGIITKNLENVLLKENKTVGDWAIFEANLKIFNHIIWKETEESDYKKVEGIIKVVLGSNHLQNC